MYDSKSNKWAQSEIHAGNLIQPVGRGYIQMENITG